MSCTINTIRKEAYRINPKAKFDSLGVYIPFDYNLKEKKVRFYRAKNEATKLLKELNVRFNSLEFGSVGGINTNYTNGVGITMKVSGKLKKAFDLKEGNITAVEFLNFVKESKEPIDFTDPELFSEQDYKDEKTYNNLNTELIKTLNDEEISYLALEDQEDMPMRFALPQKKLKQSTENTWKDARLELIEKLEKTRSQYFNKDQNKVDEINAVINSIRDEVKEFDETNKDYIKDSILNEIQILKDLITNQDLSVTEIAKSFDVNLVRSRIEGLRTQFFEGEEKDIREGRFYNLFNKEEFGYLKSEVTELEKIYDSNLETFIIGLIEDNDIVSSAMQTKTKAEQEEFFEKVQELVKDLTLADGSKYGGEILGDRSYDNILIELGALIRAVNENKEVAIVSRLKARLDPLFYKIRDKKVGDELLTDMMFKKNIFGVITDTLITPFTDAYGKKVEIVKEQRKKFLASLYTGSNEVVQDYKVMMDSKKIHYDYIKPYMISSIAAQYRNHPDFKDEGFFTASEEEMKKYEKKMREKMGNIAFEISIKKSVASLKRFLEDPETNTERRLTMNPMFFIKHFYSNDYQTYDPTTFAYPLPKYTSQIPSLSQENYDVYYSKDFKKLENSNVAEFPDFYKALSDILRYTKSRNPKGSFNSIMSLRDDLGREAMKNLSGAGKVKKVVTQGFLNVYRGFVDNGPFQNRKNLDDYDFEKDEQIQERIASYGKAQYYEMKKTMMNWSIPSLQEKAKKLELFVDTANINLDVFKEEFVEAIIQEQLNRSSSLDLRKRIHTQLDVVSSMAARKNSETGHELIKDYIRSAGADGLNVSSHLRLSMQQNLYKIGHRADKSSFISNFERKKWTLFPKVYSPAEKALAEVWEEEKKNSTDAYAFDFDGNSYSTETNKDTKTKTYYKTDAEGNKKEIELDEIDEIYKEYLDWKIDNLGLDVITGSVIKGFTNNMYQALLSISGVTGIKNRMAGMHQNNQAAASGVRGFTTSNLFVARKFLLGSNFGKYTGHRTFSAERTEQLEIFKSLLMNFNLLDKVYDEIVGENTGVAKVSLVNSKLKEFLGDFAMNNPEYHNQGELLLSMLQNVMIEEKLSDGSIIKVPFFNPKTKKLPFDKNMNFLPEFNTDNNVNGWLNEEDSKDLSAFVAKYRTIKDKLHGDFSGEKIGMDTSATSKAVIAMLKWSFENLNNQWGTKQVNLATGDINIKGRKVILAEHAPVLAMHMALQNLSLKRVALVASAVGPFGGLLMGGASILGTMLVIRTMTKQNKVNFGIAKSDWMMSLGYLLEVLTKTVRTVINTNSLYLLDIPMSSRTESIKLIGKGNISDKDRAIISESAQEVADKMNTTLRFALLGTGLKLLLMEMLVEDSDEPEEIVEKMKYYEGYFNYLVNMRTSMTTELDQWTDPTKVKDIVDAQIFLNFMKRGVTNTVKSIEQFEEGSITGGEFLLEGIGNIGGVALGVPGKGVKVLKNALSEENQGIEKITRNFSADRIYDYKEKNVLEDVILDWHLDGEEYHKKQYKEKREKVRNAIESTFRKKLISKWRKEGTYNKNKVKLDKTVSKYIDFYLKQSGINANVVPYEVLNEQVDWDILIENAEKLEF